MGNELIKVGTQKHLSCKCVPKEDTLFCDGEDNIALIKSPPPAL